MKDDRVYLLHIRDAIDRILAYTEDGKESFFSDTKTQDAVVRNLEIIGEAVKNISPELRLSQTDVPWKKMAGMRDKMIHEYFGVNLRVVWNVVEQFLPGLRREITTMLKKLDE